nr:hypothetical protein [Tanacetum cinerariifolium]
MLNSTKALENSKVSFSIPTGGIYGEVGLTTFRNAIGAHYLPHSSKYVAPPSIDVVRKWFPTTGYGKEVSTKGTLRKSLLPPRWSKEAIKGGSFKAPTGFKTNHSKRRKESILTMESNPSQHSASTLVDTEMHKEDQQATGGPTSLGVTSEERANPQLSSEASSTIKLEDLEKIVSQVQPSFKDLDLPKDDLVIIVDENDEDEPNVETEDTLIARSSSPNSLPTKLKDLPFKFNELTKEIKGLKTQVHKLEIELPKELKEIPTQLEDFTKTATTKVKLAEAKLKTLDALPCLLLNVIKALNKFAKVLSSEEAEKESTISDSDDEAHIIGSMVESFKTKKIKKFDFVIEEGEHIYLTEEQINHQEKLKKEAKAKAAKQEEDVRKTELVDLLGPKIMQKMLQIGTRMDYLHSTEAVLGINLDIPLSMQDPLDKLNDLANKKRKHVDDIHDYFKANKRLKLLVQYEDHSPGTVLNEPVLGDLDNSTSNVLIPLDSWTSGLLVYKLPLSEDSKEEPIKEDPFEGPKEEG